VTGLLIEAAPHFCTYSRSRPGVCLECGTTVPACACGEPRSDNDPGVRSVGGAFHQFTPGVPHSSELVQLRSCVHCKALYAEAVK
jgi:hypothetical protein